MDSTNSWTTVTRKNKKKQRSKINLATIQIKENDPPISAVDNTISKVNICKENLLKTNLYTSLVAQIKTELKSILKVKELVAYGLGSLYYNTAAKYQFALLLLLKSEIESNENIMLILVGYDPMWMQHDKEVVKHFGMKLIEKNEECCKNVGKTRTLFYMIHCDKHLYNNLLWANWDPDSLHEIIIVGNSFNTMQETTPNRILKSEFKYIHSVMDCKIVSEYCLKNWNEEDDVFNNTSIQTFCCNNTQNLFEKTLLPPVYEDQ